MSRDFLSNYERLKKEYKYRAQVINHLTNSEIGKWYIRLATGQLVLIYDGEKDE